LKWSIRAARRGKRAEEEAIRMVSTSQAPQALEEGSAHEAKRST